jgi:hypothetical protein
MLDSGYNKYTSRQLVVISFLSILILASLLTIGDLAEFGTQLSLITSGKQSNYFDTVDFPDIDQLYGLFPEITETDNVEANVESVISTPTLTLSPSPTLTSTPKPKAPTATKAPVVTTLPPTQAVRDYSRPWEVAANCPASTQNCIPCDTCGVPGTLCRCEPGESRGFIGQACQNNNPGNIKSSASRDELIARAQGVTSCGTRVDSRDPVKLRYMVFRDYETGYNSLKAYIMAINNGWHYTSYDSCGDCTLRFFAAKYSGSSTYADTIGTYLGVNPDEITLRTLVETRLDDLAQAIKRIEGFHTQ